MTSEQKAAFVIAQAACMMAELEAMKTFNQERAAAGSALGYDEGAFLLLADKYGLGHNAVVQFFME